MSIKSEIERTITEYQLRRPLLELLASNLQAQTEQIVSTLEHIDRVYFRAKEVESFAKKAAALDESGRRKYALPLEDIEDQVAGRLLVFFRRDIDAVNEALLRSFNRAEHTRKAPKQHDAFAYESEHFVFVIPPQVLPTGWSELTSRPTTFEVQVRTLFMHAWAEPEHDIAYKAKVPLTHDEKRKLAWAASSAWGGDAIFEQVLDSLAARSRPKDE
ncbi:MAG TPA: hypothetical protein VF493_12840 [Terriglobales bacterium]